jgi:hypothetical protein
MLDTCTSFFIPVGGVVEEEDNDVLYVKRNKIHLSRSMRRVYETIMKVVVI